MKQKPWLVIPTIITFIISPTPSCSSNIKFSASVDKSHITIEDSVELSVKISGIRNPPKPKLPVLPDFTVRTIGTHSSTQIINSKMQVSTDYKYLLIPKKKGIGRDRSDDAVLGDDHDMDNNKGSRVSPGSGSGTSTSPRTTSVDVSSSGGIVYCLCLKFGGTF